MFFLGKAAIDIPRLQRLFFLPCLQPICLFSSSSLLRFEQVKRENEELLNFKKRCLLQFHLFLMHYVLSKDAKFLGFGYYNAQCFFSSGVRHNMLNLQNMFNLQTLTYCNLAFSKSFKHKSDLKQKCNTFWHHSLAWFFMPFRMVWFILLGVLALETVQIRLYAYYQTLIPGLFLHQFTKWRHCYSSVMELLALLGNSGKSSAWFKLKLLTGVNP